MKYETEAEVRTSCKEKCRHRLAVSFADFKLTFTQRFETKTSQVSDWGKRNYFWKLFHQEMCCHLTNMWVAFHECKTFFCFHLLTVKKKQTLGFLGKSGGLWRVFDVTNGGLGNLSAVRQMFLLCTVKQIAEFCVCATAKTVFLKVYVLKANSSTAAQMDHGHLLGNEVQETDILCLVCW